MLTITQIAEILNLSISQTRKVINAEGWTYEARSLKTAKAYFYNVTRERVLELKERTKASKLATHEKVKQQRTCLDALNSAMSGLGVPS